MSRLFNSVVIFFIILQSVFGEDTFTMEPNNGTQVLLNAVYVLLTVLILLLFFLLLIYFVTMPIDKIKSSCLRSLKIRLEFMVKGIFNLCKKNKNKQTSVKQIDIESNHDEWDDKCPEEEVREILFKESVEEIDLKNVDLKNVDEDNILDNRVELEFNFSNQQSSCVDES